MIESGNGTIRGKGMNTARQISRRVGRATEARTRSAADYSITATISVVPDPLKPGNFLLEKAEAFALRIVRLYQHLSEKGDCDELIRLLASSIKTARSKS